jgi:hypothetical protein
MRRTYTERKKKDRTTQHQSPCERPEWPSAAAGCGAPIASEREQRVETYELVDFLFAAHPIASLLAAAVNAVLRSQLPLFAALRSYVVLFFCV